MWEKPHLFEEGFKNIIVVMVHVSLVIRTSDHGLCWHWSLGFRALWILQTMYVRVKPSRHSGIFRMVDCLLQMYVEFLHMHGQQVYAGAILQMPSLVWQEFMHVRVIDVH